MAETLDRLSDGQYEVQGVSGERSVKDLLIHLTMWEAQLITFLFRARQGGQPSTVHFSGESRETVNARWRASQKDRPLIKVLEEFEGIREQTLRRVEEFSDGDLTNPTRFSWLRGKPLWEWIMDDTVEHEVLHRREIEDWLAGKSG
jgi:hypothetical protein